MSKASFSTIQKITIKIEIENFDLIKVTVLPFCNVTRAIQTLIKYLEVEFRKMK